MTATTLRARAASAARPRVDEEAVQALHRTLHAAPELSGRERETAALGAERLRAAGAEVRDRLGGHGVAAVLRNGDGPVVALRAELDALPVTEATGLPYASSRRTTLDGRQVGVSHACGHDVHLAGLLAAVDALAAARDAWSGTVVALLQPDAERGRGATAMLDDGLAEQVPAPDVLLAQHVSPDPVGVVTLGADVVLAPSVALAVTLHGTGGHVAFPEAGVDTVAVLLDLLAAARTLAEEVGVGLTVTAVHGGASPSTLPGSVRADLALRGAGAARLDLVAHEIGLLARHVGGAARCPRPAEVERVAAFAEVRNDPEAVRRVHRALAADQVPTYLLTRPSPASDDVGALARGLGAPLVHWFLGAGDPDLLDSEALALLDEGAAPAGRPVNHAPDFAPHPGAAGHAARALLSAAGAWLG